MFGEVKANRLIKICECRQYEKNYFFYPWSNERIDVLYDSVNFKNKDVLSVMASGDQPLLAYLYGAKSVDTFDINPLALDHFYLRKWIIEQTDRFYLKEVTFEDGDYELAKILSNVEPRCDDEKESLIFWKKFLEYSSYIIDRELVDDSCFKIKYDFFSNYHDRLKEEVSNIDFKFYNYDIFEKNFYRKKYDILILSNMLEYKNSFKYLSIAKQNIIDILKPGGIALCSHIKHNSRSEQFDLERSALTSEWSRSYKGYGLDRSRYTICKDGREVGYKYIKVKRSDY